MEECPNGCPCENQSLDYQCPEGPVFTTTALLHRTVTALLAYPNGETEDMSITYVDPSHVGGPALFFRNQFYMYSINDVYQLQGCHMAKIGTTALRVGRGTVGRGQVVMATIDNARKLYRSSSPVGPFTEIPETTHVHNRAPIAASSS